MFQEYLQHRINKGATFLFEEKKPHLLAFAKLEEGNKKIETTFLDGQSKDLQSKIWSITVWDIDEQTDKFYAAYSAQDYIQIKPLEFADLETYRQALEACYMQLTNEVLPDLAKAQNWIIHENHCFQRVVLDNIFDKAWYEVLSKNRPAYKQLSNYQLGKAIHLANQIRKKPHDFLKQLQQKSLEYRGKAKQAN